MCSNPLTHIMDPAMLFEAAVRPIPDGWTWVNRSGKEGWQYEATIDAANNTTAVTARGTGQRRHQRHPGGRSGARAQAAGEGRRLAQAQRAGGRSTVRVGSHGISRRKPTKRGLENETIVPVDKNSLPIKFMMEFGVKPSLVASFMRSYEHFGKAIIVFDADTKFARATLVSSRAYFSSCQGDNRISGMLTRVCLQMLEGIYEEPYVLDGHWADASSQAAFATFTSGYSPATEPIHNEPLSPIVYVRNPRTRLTTSGKHTISISYVSTDLNSGTRPRFKLMGLKSC